MCSTPLDGKRANQPRPKDNKTKHIKLLFILLGQIGEQILLFFLTFLKFHQFFIYTEYKMQWFVHLHTDLAWRFSISSSLSLWSLARASLCLRVCRCNVSSVWSSCSFSCSSRAFARWTRVRFSCRRRAICSSLSDESVSSSHTRFSSNNTCHTQTK